MIEIRNLSKQFGHVFANRGVSCNVRKGRVTALLGDNGAGKTTLFKMICGIMPPSAGEILINEAPVIMHSARDALTLGVSAVYQELALVPDRDISHNISLGTVPTKLGGLLVDRSKMIDVARQTIKRLKLELPPLSTLTRDLSGGQKQAIAIARAIVQGGEAILMDEPTAALGIREQRMVLDLIADLKSHGRTILIISHNLDHVFEVADDIIVLRGGRLVAEVERASVDHDELARMILYGKPRDNLNEGLEAAL